MNRYRLLYHFAYSNERFRDEPGLNAKLIDQFGYKSDGHFYTDWNALFHDGFLRREGDMIIVTDKAKREFSFIFVLKLIELLSVLMAAVILLNVVGEIYRITIFGFPLFNVYTISATAGFLIGIAIICWWMLSIFTPAGPESANSNP